MAMAFIMEFEGATLGQYDEVIEAMGLTDGVAPEGALFHWVTETPTGIRVTDVWEDPAAFERYAAEEIGPKTAAAGIAPPQVASHDVHNVIKR